MGVLARREGSCYCVPCLGVRGRGLGTADSNLCVTGCRCRDDDGKDTQPWYELSCQRTDAQGIAERRRAAQTEGHRLAGRAKPDMWIVAQERPPPPPALPHTALRCVVAAMCMP